MRVVAFELSDVPSWHVPKFEREGAARHIAQRLAQSDERLGVSLFLLQLLKNDLHKRTHHLLRQLHLALVGLFVPIALGKGAGRLEDCAEIIDDDNVKQQNGVGLISY